MTKIRLLTTDGGSTYVLDGVVARAAAIAARELEGVTEARVDVATSLGEQPAVAIRVVLDRLTCSSAITGDVRAHVSDTLTAVLGGEVQASIEVSAQPHLACALP